ncbi:hypothetical protein LEP1GSC086_2966 [Leptospira weilii str. LNT 1234]|nr:hypothetical protein LEP1GSC086_2966 [Leptospira weilii str. LNT 1234]
MNLPITRALFMELVILTAVALTQKVPPFLRTRNIPLVINFV